MSEPRKHHFVPAFYLRKWAGNDGKLTEYSRSSFDQRLIKKRVGPKATGFQRDLYSFSDCPPGLAQHLEAVFLQRADDLASQALEKLVTGSNRPWTPDLRSAWSRFAINFLIRHPHPFEELKAAANEIWLRQDGVTQREYERLRQPEDPPTFEEWVLRKETTWPIGYAFG